MTEPKSYCEQVVDAAIQGLVEGGWDPALAQPMKFLLERVYRSGYNEGLREQYITQLGAQR